MKQNSVNKKALARYSGTSYNGPSHYTRGQPLYKATPSDTLVSGPPPASDFILGFLSHYWISISIIIGFLSHYWISIYYACAE